MTVFRAATLRRSKRVKFISFRITSQIVNEDKVILKVKWPRYLTATTHTLRPIFINYIVFKTFQYIAASKALLCGKSLSGR